MASNTRKIEILLTARDETSKAFKELESRLEKTIKKFDKLADKKKKAADASSKAGMSFGKLAGSFLAGSIAANVLTNAVGSIGDAMKSAVSTTADFEQWDVAFSTMLGNAEQADILMSKLEDFAKGTPFNLPEVVEGSKRLLAYGISADKIVSTFGALGDVSAALGRDKLPNLITAFGQIKAKGRLMGQELLQLREAGFDLSEAMGVTNAALEEMVSNGEVSFKDVEDAFIGVTSEGGKFFDMMKNQSKTFGGIMSNIQDSFTILGKNIMEQTGAFDVLKLGADTFRQAMEDNSDKIIALVTNMGKGLRSVMDEIAESFALAGGGGEAFWFILDGIATVANKAYQFFRPLLNIVQILIKTFSLGVGNIGNFTDALVGLVTKDFRMVEQAVASTTARMSAYWGSVQGDFGDMLDANEKFSSLSMVDIRGAWNNLATGAKSTLGELTASSSDAFEEISADAKEKLEDIAKSMKELTEEFKNQVQQQKDSFKEHLSDVLWKHKDNQDKLEKSYTDETKKYEEELAKRKKSYEKSILAIEEKAKDNTSAVYEKYEEETKAIQENLLRQISSGQDSDETFIELAQRRLAELEKLRQKELADIQKAKDKETAELDSSYNEQMNDLTNSHQDTLSEIQSELDIELALQKKYADEFKLIKNKMRLDDIAQAKLDFEKQLAEMDRQQAIKIQKLKDQEKEIKGGGSSSSSSGSSSSGNSSKSGSGSSSNSSGTVDYIVKAGDTLWGIAQKMLGNGARWGEIGGFGGDPTKLSIGTTLKVPKAQEGMILQGTGAKPIIAHGGETILTPAQTRGLLNILENFSANKQTAGGQGGSFVQTNNINATISNDYNVDSLAKRLAFNGRTAYRGS